MDKKDILMVIVIAAVVGVVASLITTNVSGDASLSPGISNVADACNGDKVCEMNNALIAGELEADEAIIGGMLVKDELHVGDDISSKNIRTTNLMVDDGLLQAENAMMGSLGIGFSGFSNLSEELEVIGSGVFRSTLGGQIVVGIEPTLENPIWATAYAGNGTGYACISAHGNIFRSEDPCN